METKICLIKKGVVQTLLVYRLTLFCHVLPCYTKDEQH